MRIGFAPTRRTLLQGLTGLAASAALPAVAWPKDGYFSGGDPAVHHIGRFDFRGPAPRAAWSGTGIITKFEGTGISAVLTGADTYFQVNIDGGPARVVKSRGDGQPVELARDLPRGEHELRLFRRTEASFGDVAFEELIVDQGRLIPSPRPFVRTIETVGASQVCGYGNEGIGPGCAFSAETENSRASFGAFLAGAFNAMHATVAWSGRGITRDAGGGTVGQLPANYERALPTDAKSIYGFDQYRPDVIVLNCGTNDYGPGDPGKPFEDGYIDFIAQLRERNPQAAIICTTGPMQTAPTYPERVQRVVEACRAAGDARVAYVKLDPINAEADGMGCGYHPSVATHRKMAAQLEPVVRELTGW